MRYEGGGQGKREGGMRRRLVLEEGEGGEVGRRERVENLEEGKKS